MRTMLRDSRPAGLSALLLALLAAPPARAQVVEYYHTDAIGNVRAITDASGNVIERHDYQPYGEEWLPQGGTQPLRFTGKERDVETGLDYFGARYYGSKIGRFTTTDPVYTWQENLVDPQRWNRYAYARNNPLRYTDPDGKFIVPALVVVGVAAVYAILASPDIANAPGPNDPTFKSDQSGKLIANAALAVTSLKAIFPTEGLSPPDQGNGRHDNRVGPGLDKNTEKRIRGLERQVEEHEQKLRDYTANPDAHDNKGFLRNAPDGASRQRIIDSRVRSLEGQIGTFKRDIEALRSGGGGGD